MTYTTGLTVFNIKPGEKGEMYCSVCESRCEVTRNQFGYKDFGSAMMKKKSRFDQFICPLAEEEWHQKLENLILEKRETASSKIKQLLEEEIDEIKAEYLG